MKTVAGRRRSAGGTITKIRKGDTVMFLKTAFIFSKEPKTDAALSAVMATHPWAPAMIHGLRTIRSNTKENEVWDRPPPDSVYVDDGYGVSREKWLVENFHTPDCFLRLGFDEQCRRLEVCWWKATIDLLLHSIPPDYHVHVVFYGELEDEFEPGAADKAWKRAILEAYDYDPEIVAEFEPAAA
jgi:hypothetical protein